MNERLLFMVKMLMFVALFCGVNASLMAQTKKIDSLLVALKSEKSERAKIPIVDKLSKCFTTVDLDKKYFYAKQLKSLGEKYKIDSIVAIAILDIGTVQGIKTDHDSSMYYFTKGLAFAKEKKVYSQEARA